MKDTAEAERRLQQLRKSVLSDGARQTGIPSGYDIRSIVGATRGDVARIASARGKPLPDAAVAKTTVGGTLKRGFKVFGGMLGTLSAVLLANTLTFGLVNRMFGLVPRTVSGLSGIVLHPLLHANLQHLAGNAVGLVTLGGIVFLRNERDFWRATIFGTLFGGTIEWLIGPAALHVGASGVVFAYLGYLLTTGWFDRKPGAILLSVVVGGAFGTALTGLSPMQTGISWQLHALGLAAGVMVAWWRKKRG